jgi:hypothetical protein
VGFRNHLPTCPTNHQPGQNGHRSIKNDIQRCGQAPPSLCHPWQPFCDQEEEAERLIGCQIADLVGFKNDLLAPTIKFNKPAQFWNIQNIQTQIEAHHRIRNRILLEDASSHNLGSPTCAMTGTTPTNSALGQLDCNSLKNHQTS